jgi:ABC-type antimicrobial peptide transport system permease subunit
MSDPVAVGIIGALGLGAIAAALFALIGLVVAASVSARQRQNEFALLRALGLSRRQLTGWLWFENGSLALVSLVAGIALGAIISLVVLPNVTVTGDGSPPTPTVLVTLPLATIALLAAAASISLVVVLFVMATALRRFGIGNVLRLGEE